MYAFSAGKCHVSSRSQHDSDVIGTADLYTAKFMIVGVGNNKT